jgi:hypothetical protein
MSTDSDDLEVRRRVETALRQLSVLDSHLLQHDANERAITHRLAVYLANHFDGWEVDCEYDQLGDAPSRLFSELERQLAEVSGEEPLTRDTMGRTVYPDVIVHRRGTQENLLAIEVKKSTNPVPGDFDRTKLAGYKDDPDLRFRYACIVRLEVSRPGDSSYGNEPYSVEFI